MYIVKILLAVIFISMGKIFAQERCGTMEYYRARLTKDPSIKERELFYEKQISNLQKERLNFLFPKSEKEKYPPLPGLILTNDPELNARNFAKIKQELYSQDPELYRKLSRRKSEASEREKLRLKNNKR